MKKLALIVLVGILISFLPGCDLNDDDCYSVNDAWVGFGLVQKDSLSDTFIIKMDDGEVLYPTNNSLSWHKVTDNERVLTNFTILGNKKNPNHNEEYYVRINSLRKILYKGILDITPENEDSIGNDPIHVHDKWIKGNMLNFELKYKGGNEIHFINLVKQPGEITSASEPVVLELRHNTNGDTEKLPLSAIVTFDLSSLKIEGKNSTQFKVIAKEPDGSEFEYTAEYKY
ncbi:MAG: NigD-like protein [Prolixibacteraceae bacterium]